jgi:hypothetical protein
MPPGLVEGAVAAGGLSEFADGPFGLVLDPAADCQCREDDGQVGLDRVAQVVIDGPGLQVVLGHPEALLDFEEPAVGADHELGGDGCSVGQAARLVTYPFSPAKDLALAALAIEVMLRNSGLSDHACGGSLLATTRSASRKRDSQSLLPACIPLVNQLLPHCFYIAILGIESWA